MCREGKTPSWSPSQEDFVGESLRVEHAALVTGTKALRSALGDVPVWDDRQMSVGAETLGDEGREVGGLEALMCRENTLARALGVERTGPIQTRSGKRASRRCAKV
jgi:hypothetical protein